MTIAKNFIESAFDYLSPGMNKVQNQRLKQVISKLSKKHIEYMLHWFEPGYNGGFEELDNFISDAKYSNDSSFNRAFRAYIRNEEKEAIELNLRLKTIYGREDGSYPHPADRDFRD